MLIALTAAKKPEATGSQKVQITIESVSKTRNLDAKIVQKRKQKSSAKKELKFKTNFSFWKIDFSIPHKVVFPVWMDFEEQPSLP